MYRYLATPCGANNSSLDNPESDNRPNGPVVVDD